MSDEIYQTDRDCRVRFPKRVWHPKGYLAALEMYISMKEKHYLWYECLPDHMVSGRERYTDIATYHFGAQIICSNCGDVNTINYYSPVGRIDLYEEN